jgi:amidase
MSQTSEPPAETDARVGPYAPLALGAARLSALLRAGELRAVDVVQASLHRIAETNDRLNAFLSVAESRAMQDAREADQRQAAGAPLGPLHGVPVAIKDLVATKGLRTTFGSTIFRDHVPEDDDLTVARLRSAGAIVVGKTNTPEFGFGAITANELRGPTRNPYDERLTSGGSSGGSAVAVAAEIVPVAHGTDFGGSTRTPASFCGVVGMRPTPGVIPSTAKRLPWDAFAVHGAIARNVEDALLIVRVMSGGDLRDPIAAGRPPLDDGDLGELDPGGCRVACSPDLGIASVDRTVEEGFERAIAAMEGAGIRVERAHPDCSGAQESFETIRAAMLYDSLGPYLESGFDQLTPAVQWNVGRGRDLSARALLAAEATRGAVYRRFCDFFTRYDILATVSASVLPFPIEQGNVFEINGAPLRNIIDYLTITYVISLVGCPAISIPCGWSADGLPIGLQLVARPFDDNRLARFAHLLQERLGFRYRPPTTHSAIGGSP